jgi:hypothetical protein
MLEGAYHPVGDPPPPIEWAAAPPIPGLGGGMTIWTFVVFEY